MAPFNFITVRLGKDSIPDIQKICVSGEGALDNPFTINVKCTQIPDNYGFNDYAFLWLGSDNNKGMPTQWKQGFKAIGRVKGVTRGTNYNDTSITNIEIVYIFADLVSFLTAITIPVLYLHKGCTVSVYAKAFCTGDILICTVIKLNSYAYKLF